MKGECEALFEEKKRVIRESQKRFILRERLRRELLKTKPGGTICLTYEKTQMLTKWIKELEERAGVHGFTER